MESSVAEGYHVMKISHWIWLCLLDDVEIHMLFPSVENIFFMRSTVPLLRTNLFLTSWLHFYHP